MKYLLQAFLFPGVIFPIPAGQQGVDSAGANGLIGLMANANAYAENISSMATSGTTQTLIAANVVSGVVLLNSGASGPLTLTLPNTGQIIAALPSSIPLDGSYSERITFVNNGVGQPVTLVVGDGGTTIIGPAIIGSNVARTYLMRVLGSASISLQNLGQLPL